MFARRRRLTGCFSGTFSFLEDYLREPIKHRGRSRPREIVIAYVSANPGVTLDDLLRLTEGKVSPDDIFSMIAANDYLRRPPCRSARRARRGWQSWLRQKQISKTRANLVRNPHTPVLC